MMKKAPFFGAFFIAFILTACAEQTAPSGRSIHQLNYVVDGDTIVVDEDIKVRLVGVNTPEMGYANRRQEPFAKQAKNKLKVILGKGKVQLEFDREKQDKHGRVLAHVYSDEGENAQTQLLKHGLAFAVAVSDNQTYLNDYLKAEAIARRKKLGIWNDAYFAPKTAEEIARKHAKGYRRVSGVVVKTSKSNKNIALHLGEHFKVLIPRKYWKSYFRGKPKQYLNKHIVARGWVFTSNNFSGIKVYHPSMIE